MKIRKTALILFSLLTALYVFNLSPLWAQTDRIALEWDANSESDMYLYRVFKGNDANHLKQVDSIYHP